MLDVGPRYAQLPFSQDANGLRGVDPNQSGIQVQSLLDVCAAETTSTSTARSPGPGRGSQIAEAPSLSVTFTLPVVVRPVREKRLSGPVIFALNW